MEPSPTTHVSLLVRLRQSDDRDAWSRFVDVYAPLCYGYFRRRNVQDADAADLTQDVLQVVARRVDQFAHGGGKGAFRGWLFAICRNKLRQWQAKTATRQSRAVAPAELEQIPAEDDDAAWWQQEHQRRVFAWAAEQVRPTVEEATWQAFWQTTVEGQSGQQVADELGKSLGAVYVAKSRVMARLRTLIEQVEEA